MWRAGPPGCSDETYGLRLWPKGHGWGQRYEVCMGCPSACARLYRTGHEVMISDYTNRY